MVKFAKVIINRNSNEYRNLHFLPDIFKLMVKYERFMFDDYFGINDLADALYHLIESSGRFFWVILNSDTEEFMGFAYFDKFIGNENNLHSAEINTCFCRKYWGQPVRDTAKKFIRYCFKKYQFQKIKASVFKENTVVKGLLRSLGFKKEALLKGETFKNNKLQDVEIYSILRREKCK
ncbi:GNAT family N-acetyltransferase [bacterium]|nr:GNAT family N-acetyltransferase [bacterium]